MIRIAVTGEMSDAMMEEMIENLMTHMPPPRKTSRNIPNAKEALEKVMERFKMMTNQLLKEGISVEEDLVEHQNSLQALYSRILTVLDAAAVQQKWEADELTRLKGQVKYTHSRSVFVIKEAKKKKQLALAKIKASRRESQVAMLIGNLDQAIGTNGITTEKTATKVEETAAKLWQEASLLDKEIDKVAMLDQGLAARLEKLRCSATSSMVKATGSIRKFRNEDEYFRRRTSSMSFLKKKKATETARQLSKAASKDKIVRPEVSGYTKAELDR